MPFWTYCVFYWIFSIVIFCISCDRVGGYVCKKKRQNLDASFNFNRTMEGAEGVLTTPNYPENYYNNLDFLVRIVGPERTRLKIR